ncbi:unnamed protein product [Closterium sp. NIES-53]
MDAEMASWKSAGTYDVVVPSLGANIVDGMWIFRVKRPPGSPPAFKARYVARGFNQRQGHDYELHSLDFSKAFLQGSLHEEIWLRRQKASLGRFLQKRHTCTNLGELHSYLGLHITQDRGRCTITLTQSHMVHQVLQRFGFHYSSPQSTPLPTGHSLSPPPSDKSGGKRYFLLVVDDYTQYTTVFPLQSKVDVRNILIRWIRAVRRQLSARFQQDLLVLRLHSDRGGEFSSCLLEDFCGTEGITQLFKIPASPHQNGIAECRIGLVMEVARTSMVHAVAPHFL